MSYRFLFSRLMFLEKNYFMCMVILPVCVSVPHECLVVMVDIRERVLDPLTEVIGNCHIDAGLLIQAHWKSSQYS